MDSDKEARIRQRAYEIWQREGRPEGRDAEHWQQAEAEVMAEADTTADRAAAGSEPQGEPPGGPGPAPLRSRRAARSERDRPSGTNSAGRSASPRRGRKPAEP